MSATAILKTLRATMPSASGVMLATDDGLAVAHDLPRGMDAAEAALEAAARLREARFDAIMSGAGQPASVFLDSPAGPVLVVFIAPPPAAAASAHDHGGGRLLVTA
jgi:predicted regulator of Ras-like GTPase activity (Roadblock/LC7/MglB family)